MAAPKDSDLAFLNATLPDFGWGTLETLARDFEIQVEVHWRHYELIFTTRDPAGIVYRFEMVKNGGGLHHREPVLPGDRSHDAAGLAEVDAVLRDVADLWWVEPTNGTCTRRDLRGGLASLTDLGTLQTLRRPHGAVLLFQKEVGDPLFSLDVDLEKRDVVAVRFIDVPMNPDGWHIDRAAFAFIDQSLRTHGDFGVYGSVTEGLAALVDNFEVRLRRGPDGISVSVVPRDGHGHFLDFQIQPDGVIHGCAAGHLETDPLD